MHKAMIFAAGKGTRLRPLTNEKPKALVEVKGKTLLEHAISKLKSSGITDIIINVHHFSQQIVDFVKSKDFGITIQISDESSKLLDTGGGLLNAKEFFKDTDSFVVYNVDIISTINLREFFTYHSQSKALVSLAVQNRDTSRYLLFDDNHFLCGWRNKATNDFKIMNERDAYLEFAFSGIQIVDTSIFDFIIENGVFSIMHLYLRLAKEHTIIAYNHSHDFWLDVGKFNELSAVEKQLLNMNI